VCTPLFASIHPRPSLSSPPARLFLLMISDENAG
jgi:hypothetical protein